MYLYIIDVWVVQVLITFENRCPELKLSRVCNTDVKDQASTDMPV